MRRGITIFFGTLWTGIFLHSYFGTAPVASVFLLHNWDPPFRRLTETETPRLLLFTLGLLYLSLDQRGVVEHLVDALRLGQLDCLLRLLDQRRGI